MNPSVSVVVTTYNQAPYIEQTVESVLAQTYAPHEVIVVDDGSIDDTPSRMEQFDGRITYIRQKNQGVAGSRNTGIRKARGELIAFLDGDDLWESEKLAVQVSLAQAYPRSGLIVVDGVEFNDNEIVRSSLLSADFWKEFPGHEVESGNHYHRLLQRQFISTSSQVMVPAKVFEIVGLSNGKFSRANDWDLYIRIAARFDVTVCKDRLTRWRCLESSASGPKTKRYFSYLPEEFAILQHHLRRAQGEERAFLRRTIRERVAEGLEELYYFGLKTDKAYARRLLLRLSFMHSSSRTAFIFLAGLCCPRWIARKMGRAARTMTTVSHE